MEAAFDGDPTWRETHVLADGTEITLRPIVSGDKDELRRAYQEASPRTRYFRFLGASPEPSDALFAYFCDVDQKDHVAFVATKASLDLKTEEGVGIARFVRLKDEPHVAEAALAVRDDMQRRGIGKILMQALERSARAHGIRIIRAEVLAENSGMRAILDRAGAHALPFEAGSHTASYDIELSHERHKTLLDILRAAAETAKKVSATFATNTRQRERE